MYYEGMSLQEIRRNLIQQHNGYISDVTALNWVNRFSKPAIIEAGKYKPDVGRVWVADETVIDIDGNTLASVIMSRLRSFCNYLSVHHTKRCFITSG